MWFLVVDPGSDQWYEFDIPTGAFNVSQDGHHFAATFDHGVVKVYFDGTELSGSWYGGAAPTFDHWDLKGNPLRFGRTTRGPTRA